MGWRQELRSWDWVGISTLLLMWAFVFWSAW